MMTNLLAARLELAAEPPVLGEPIWVRMTISNDSDDEIEIANPALGVPPPSLGWKASNQAYQIALLISLG